MKRFGLVMIAATSVFLGASAIAVGCSSSDTTSTSTDAGNDATLAVCPAIEPEISEPCPTHEGLACTYGCDSFVCKSAQWTEQGSINGDNDGGGCPAVAPTEHTPCTVATCASVVICSYACENQLGTLQAQCVTAEWEVDFSDPRCAIALDGGNDLDAGDDGD